MKEKTIEVRAGFTQTEVLRGQCNVVDPFDTIGEAKRKAKYYLIDDYQRMIESSRPMQYAQVVVDGQCLYDYFRKGYNGDQPPQDRILKVQGTQIEHTVVIRPVMEFADTDAMMAEYRVSDRCGMQCWAPENGASFKSMGAATGWLKKQLGRPGWPKATNWIIQEVKVINPERSFIEIYLNEKVEG